jgi:dTDP-4-dehydrorhamnose reductase
MKMEKSRILILGASGMLGVRLCTFLREKEIETLTQSRFEGYQLIFNPANKFELQKNIIEYKPDVIINLCAMTDVDKCEIDYDLALQANIGVAKALNEIFFETKHTPFIIHLSTDQVYSGAGYHKEDLPNPINNYSKTKLLAEQFIINTNGIVLRTNFVGHSKHQFRLSLSDWVIKSLNNNQNINVFENIYFTPLHQNTLCQLIEKILSHRVSGIFNAGCIDGGSKADFAFAIAKKLKLPDTLMRKSNFIAKTGEAIRPTDMRMNSQRICDALKWNAPTLADEIELIEKEIYA